jgi:metal-responsive CopG/Arc/MetJ family transcriptional regulator
MKIAISLPDIIFDEAEKLARKANKSRSQLYVEALTEYLSRHTPDTITETMNKVCEKLGDEDTYFVSEASRKILARETW